LRDWGVRSTIIVLGSSRIPPPEQAERAVAEAADDAGGVVGEAYWRRIVTSRLRPPRAWISPDDVALFEYAETAEEGGTRSPGAGFSAMRRRKAEACVNATGNALGGCGAVDADQVVRPAGW